MYAGWRWRFSRDLEVAAMMAAVVGNRIPMNKKVVDEPAVCRRSGLYDRPRKAPRD